MKRIIFWLFGIILSSFVLPISARAATLDLVSDKDTFPINQDIKLDVKINSEGASINGAQATLQFDKSVIEVKSADKTGSIFDFWVADPQISNADGKVSFIAASTTGYTGQSLQVARITLRAKGPGKTNLFFTDAAVTASDGSGTNVLSKVNGLTINFVAAAESAEIGKPTQIVRPAAPAKGLPKKPVIEVPLYPDPTKWNNVSSKFFARWALPDDVTLVSAILDKSAETFSTRTEGLFEEKSFPLLEDGTYYIHARFANSIGWGPVLHYRIAVDTTPPSPFTISFSDGSSSDNPTPTVSHGSSDSLSGIDHYEIKVSRREVIASSADQTALPPLMPGSYAITIRAYDAAGNATQSTADFEILPIAGPVITSVSREAYTGEGNLFVSGTSVPGNKINLSVNSRAGDIFFIGSVKADERGNWDTNITQPLRTGNYVIEATAEDARGALSLPVMSDIFKVRQRSLFTVAGVGITPFMFIVFLLIVIAGIVTAGLKVYQSQSLKVARRVIIAQRDVAAMANVIAGNIEKLSRMVRHGELDKEELKVILDKAKADSERMKKYVVDNIGEIKD